MVAALAEAMRTMSRLRKIIRLLFGQVRRIISRGVSKDLTIMMEKMRVHPMSCGLPQISAPADTKRPRRRTIKP